MIVKEKYYTPSIEEFHVGFEYEFKHPDYEKWNKYETPEFNFEREDCIPFSGNLDCFRVKYLDKEDIESLGFNKRFKDEWIGWKDYALDTISGEISYFLSASIHVPTMDDCYKIYLHRYLENDTKIETKINEGESELVYKGKIKNKGELKMLLKKLSII